ncbi:MAG TPA: GIY-YIG nuclease family protein, partial [Rariglobus sp.]
MPASEPINLKEKVRHLTEKPGVYLMKDRLGRIIYVGKAKALKKRVSSYFTPSRAMTFHPKIRALIEMIADFDVIEVKSEPEALLLEGKLIKQWKPKYNTDFVDDKRFLLVRVDLSQELPRFALTRFKKDDRSRYFGPFAHSGLLRKTLAQMRRQFGILLGDATPQRLPDGRWQLYDDVRQELYGFANETTAEDYRRRVDDACAFLDGKSREWLETLRAEMMAAAEKHEFEKAAELRDIVFALQKTLAKTRTFERSDPSSPEIGAEASRLLGEALGLKTAPRTLECFDISHISGTFVVASMVHFADGRPDKDHYRRFQIKSFIGNDDFRAMEEVV